MPFQSVFAFVLCRDAVFHMVDGCRVGREKIVTQMQARLAGYYLSLRLIRGILKREYMVLNTSFLTW